MMPMPQGISQKIKAALHIIVGPQHMSLQYETNEGAEAAWNKVTGLLKMTREKKDDDGWFVLNHENGAMWLDAKSVNGVTWTKEGRQVMPVGIPGLRQ